ncbi:MAG: hypothetical protein JXR96_17500 [Deltaproteobacteria bacterium]|nr:hypothetical protein [Deltaproteobacteria bacterium]
MRRWSPYILLALLLGSPNLLAGPAWTPEDLGLDRDGLPARWTLVDMSLAMSLHSGLVYVLNPDVASAEPRALLGLSMMSLGLSFHSLDQLSSDRWAEGLGRMAGRAGALTMIGLGYCGMLRADEHRNEWAMLFHAGGIVLAGMEIWEALAVELAPRPEIDWGLAPLVIAPPCSRPDAPPALGLGFAAWF